MFFPTIVAAPLIAGVLAGVITGRRLVPFVLAAVCVALGIAGAVAIVVDADTTDRASATAFAVIAGLVAAGLVWLGYSVGRVTRRSASHA